MPCCCSGAQSYMTLHNPLNCSTSGFSVLHHLLKFAQTHVHWVCDAIQPSHLCHPLLLLPSIFPSITVFSNKSALHIMWPKQWSFSFSICPSGEYSGLISFRIDWFDFLPVKGLSRVFSSITVQKHQFFCTQPSDMKSQLIGKDPDAWKDWRQEEKRAAEDEMVGWHHQWV